MFGVSHTATRCGGGWYRVALYNMTVVGCSEAPSTSHRILFIFRRLAESRRPMVRRGIAVSVHLIE